jgi:hypothetical protein
MLPSAAVLNAGRVVWRLAMLGVPTTADKTLLLRKMPLKALAVLPRSPNPFSPKVGLEVGRMLLRIPVTLASPPKPVLFRAPLTAMPNSEVTELTPDPFSPKMALEVGRMLLGIPVTLASPPKPVPFRAPLTAMPNSEVTELTPPRGPVIPPGVPLAPLGEAREGTVAPPKGFAPPMSMLGLPPMIPGGT